MSVVTGRQSYTLPHARQLTMGFSSWGRELLPEVPALPRLPLRLTRIPSMTSGASCSSCSYRHTYVMVIKPPSTSHVSHETSSLGTVWIHLPGVTMGCMTAFSGIPPPNDPGPGPGPDHTRVKPTVTALRSVVPDCALPQPRGIEKMRSTPAEYAGLPGRAPLCC